MCQFAAALRDLRRQKKLTVRAVAEAMHYSPSVVSRMASGRMLPTWELTSAFVLACGGDPKQWRRLWAQTAGSLAAQSPASHTGPEADPAGATKPSEFVAQLRLRINRNQPSSYRWLARKTSYSHSTIASALSDSAQRLPKWRLVACVLEALGDEPAQIEVWRAAWSRLQEVPPAGPPATPQAYPSIAAVAPPVGLLDPQRRVRGRDRLIDHLVGLANADADAGIHLLHGTGGAGKTMVALEVATAIAGRGGRVWWVSAAEQASLVAGMTTVARDVGVSEEELRKANPADALWRRLAGERDRWLLVLDGVDDPAVLDTHHGGSVGQGTGWIRPTSKGLILVTSRNRRWPNWCRRHEVSELNIDDAAQVLLDYSGEEAGDPEEAEALARALGRLPLMLKLAGSFLARTANAPLPDPSAPTTFQAYRERFEAMEVPEAAPGELVDEIQKVWDLSLELLTRRGLPDAHELLRLLVTFADAPIPFRLLFTPESLKDTRLRQPTMAGVSNLLEALEQVSLINLDRGGPPQLAKLHIHALVRTAGRVHPYTIQRVQSYLASAIALLCRAGDSLLPPEHPMNWPAWGLIAPHALHLLETSRKADAPEYLVGKAGQVAVLAMRSMIARGEFHTAVRKLRSVRETMYEVFGHEDRNTLLVTRELATALRKTGQYREAEKAGQAAWKLSARLLGEAHEDTLDVRRDLAIVHLELGRYHESQAALREVSEQRREILGTEHPETLSTLHALARVLCELGRYRQAQTLFAEVHEARVRVLGPEHPDTLTTLRNSARVFDDLGRYPEAEKIYVELHETSVHVLGEEHPDTLLARFDLAKNRLNQGHFAEAEAELQKVLDGRRRILGDDHPRTLTARRFLAITLHQMGLWEEAEAEYDAVFQSRVALLGPCHPHTLSARFSLAIVWRELGNLEAARGELEAIHAEQVRQLGDEHRDTLNTHHELGVTLRDLGLYDEAEAAFDEVCRRRGEVLGDEHPDTLRGRRDRAELLLMMDRMDAALAENTAVHRLSVEVLGDEHPETLHARNDLARLHLYLHEKEKARRELDSVYRLRSRTLGVDHPDTLTTRRMRARVLHADGNIDEAEREYRSVLKARIRRYGRQHPCTLVAFANIARVLLDRGEVQRAEFQFRMVYQARRQALGPEHPHTVATRHDLGCVLARLGRSAEAAVELAAVLEARMRLLGPEHRDIAETRDALETLMDT